MSKVYRKVGLEGVRFFSPIGYFKEERILKNEFVIDLFVGFEVETIETDDLKNTIDYSQLYEICVPHFKKEAQLIEHVTHAILEDIKEKYNFIKEVSIKIKKINPPIQAQINNSFIELHYTL